MHRTAAAEVPSSAVTTTAATTHDSTAATQGATPASPAQAGEAGAPAPRPAAALIYVRLTPDDARARFWALAKRERNPVLHEGKPHVLVAWTELLDPYNRGPNVVEVTLMLAAEYADLRAREAPVDHDLPTRPARPGGPDATLSVTNLRPWRSRS